jgi:hypothetical protein
VIHRRRESFSERMNGLIGESKAVQRTAATKFA